MRGKSIGALARLGVLSIFIVLVIGLVTKTHLKTQLFRDLKTGRLSITGLGNDIDNVLNPNTQELFVPNYYLPGEAIVQDVRNITEFISDIPCEEVLDKKNVVSAELSFPDSDIKSDKKVRALYCIDSDKVQGDPNSAVISHSGILGDYEIQIDTNNDGKADLSVKPSALLKLRVSNKDLVNYYLEHNTTE